MPLTHQMKKSYPLTVAKCDISISYQIKESPTYNFVKSKSDGFKTVSIKNNDILDEIMFNYEKIQPKRKFLILVNGNRYGIKTLFVSEKMIVLEQYFLHFDGKLQNLVPYGVRYVNISLKQ